MLVSFRAGFRLEGFDLVHFQLRSNDFAIRRDANMLADIRQCCAPNHLNCGMRKSLCAIFSWHFSSAVQSLPRRHKTTGQDQTPPITMFRAIQPAAETTSRRIIRRTRTAVQAITTALKAITTPTTGRQAEATEELCRRRAPRPPAGSLQRLWHVWSPAHVISAVGRERRGLGGLQRVNLKDVVGRER